MDIYYIYQCIYKNKNCLKPEVFIFSKDLCVRKHDSSVILGFKIKLTLRGKIKVIFTVILWNIYLCFFSITLPRVTLTYNLYNLFGYHIKLYSDYIPKNNNSKFWSYECSNLAFKDKI